MAAKSSFKNMTLCLLTICLVCSALLALVSHLTAAPIAQAQQNKTNATLAQVLPDFEKAEPRMVTVDGTDFVCYEATADTSVVGYAVISSVIGFGGTLQLMVGFDAEGKVWSTSVLSHSETPGLGANCTNPAFKDQFDRITPVLSDPVMSDSVMPDSDRASKKLQVRKDGGDIDAITASTITSRAYCKAVEQACRIYQLLAVMEESHE